MPEQTVVVLRLTPEETEDVEEIQARLQERQGGRYRVPRSRAALAAIRWYAAELRRRKRREPGEEG